MSKLHTSGFRLLLVACSLWLVACGSCFAQPVSSTELINNAKQYDGQTVAYKGEVIGDIMVRGKYAWINVNDGINAIGIWVDRNLIQDIVYAGSYKSRGDLVEIIGVFHRACPQHGGDLDIHAQAVRKISTGRPVLETLSPRKITIAAILLGALCLALILRQLKTK